MTKALKELPSVTRLRELLRYEPETGKLFWRSRADSEFSAPQYAVTWNTRFSGVEAGAKKPSGYTHVCVDGKLYLAHRLIWAMVYGASPKVTIDHVDQDQRNNRIDNLRAAGPQVNMMNRSMPNTNTSGYAGVSRSSSGKRWRAVIQVLGKWTHLGTFDNPEEASLVWQQARDSFGFASTHGRAR